MISNIYYIIAGIAYSIFIMQFILSQFFGDFDVDTEADFSVSDIVSFKGLIHFCIGCFSYLSYQQYSNQYVNTIDWVIAIGAGVICVVVLYFVYKLFIRFNHIPTTEEGKALVGKHGKVIYVTETGASVKVFVNGENKTIKCENLTKNTLVSGQDVTIIKYQNNQFYI